jgi:uncharacterized protein DUF397
VTVPHRWRKSSSSNQDGACVEVAHTLDALRDSKNPGGPVLSVRGFPLLLAKCGDLDAVVVVDGSPAHV